MNYESKAPSRVILFLVQFLMVVSIACCFAGAYMGLTYTYPMLTGSYQDAAKGGIGDPASALYNAGLEAYRSNKFRYAETYLKEASEKVVNREGIVPENKKSLAAEIKFLLGNTLVKSKQKDQAVQAYKEALRLNPAHLYAKYNLELLTAPKENPPDAPGKGQGQGNEPGQEPGKEPGQEEPSDGAGKDPPMRGI